MENTLFSFEEAYARLEEILHKLNSGLLGLEESLSLYEEADKLIRICSNKLAGAEQKIQTLIKNRNNELALDANGKPITQDFQPVSEAPLKQTPDATRP